jgi:hypothetical protein
LLWPTPGPRRAKFSPSDTPRWIGSSAKRRFRPAASDRNTVVTC